MKKFIGVPISLMRNEALPNEAQVLAKQLLLEIRAVDSNLKAITVLTEPEFAFIEYDNIVDCGYIWSVDVINEFHSFSSNTKLILNDKEFFPRILEKHKCLFRIRINEIGNFDFIIFDNKEIFTGMVTVI